MTQYQKPQDQYLSRSALANKLDIPLKDLTQLMVDSGWVVQLDKVWQLTAKGEFEGGVYRQSPKYGQYIAWPLSIIEHPVLRGSREHLVSVSSLAKPMAIPPRLFNRLLAELGWISPFAKGWRLTALGGHYGGVQFHDDHSGGPYVMWPRAVLDSDALAQSLVCFAGDGTQRALDGRAFERSAHRQIANWLYLLGFAYSYSKRFILPEGELLADFYLPAHHLFIDYWLPDLSAGDLAEQLRKRNFYTSYRLQRVELNPQELETMDRDLAKQLVQLGIGVY